jgi:hypothetical protein
MATDYSECPECGDDGPHTVIDGGQSLECGECATEFPNPFASDFEES